MNLLPERVCDIMRLLKYDVQAVHQYSWTDTRLELVPMTDIVSSHDFYVYTLTNSLTNTVFYVGKGRGDRLHDHERKSRKGLQSPVILSVKFGLVKGLSLPLRFMNT